MIVPQPQFGERRWFMNYPSDACPESADNDVPEEPPAVWPRLRVIDGGKNEARWPEPQRGKFKSSIVNCKSPSHR
jgi:hypothetical protein